MQMTEFMDLYFNGDFKRPTSAVKQKLLDKAVHELSREREAYQVDFHQVILSKVLYED